MEITTHSAITCNHRHRWQGPSIAVSGAHLTAARHLALESLHAQRIGDDELLEEGSRERRQIHLRGGGGGERVLSALRSWQRLPTSALFGHVKVGPPCSPGCSDRQPRTPGRRQAARYAAAPRLPGCCPASGRSRPMRAPVAAAPSMAGCSPRRFCRAASRPSRSGAGSPGSRGAMRPAHRSERSTRHARAVGEGRCGERRAVEGALSEGSLLPRRAPRNGRRTYCGWSA